MHLTLAAAAAKLHLAADTLEKFCEEGRIPGVRREGGTWLLPKDAKLPDPAPQKWPQVPDELPLLLLPEDVSCALGVSRATVRNWIRSGRIAPDVGGYFSRAYVKRLIESLSSDESAKLKARRNKSAVRGRELFDGYISDAHNRALGVELLASGLVRDDEDLKVLLANFALQLYFQSRGAAAWRNNLLADFIADVSVGDGHESFRRLVVDLLDGTVPDEARIGRLLPALTRRLNWVRGEDALGFLYLSLRDLGLRKSTGTYYTPERIVRRLIENLRDAEGDLSEKTFCDPCCGSGNFLLGLLTAGVDRKLIYGQDVDATSVRLARINVALMEKDAPTEELCAHFTVGDSLLDAPLMPFDVVLGNPPWGAAFTKRYEDELRRRFRTARGARPESSALMVEKAFSMLTPQGTAAFVLPESILTVSSHAVLRRLMLERCDFRFAAYLGEAFPGVQCASVILGLRLNAAPTVVGCRVSTGGRAFVIGEPRTFPEDVLALDVSEEEARCLAAMERMENAAHLKGHAKFALGIVTGDNKAHLSAEKLPGMEPVLKGGDIRRFGIGTPKNFIRFTPDAFQQVAPTAMYRAEEKLLYRFISEVPVFAYDDGRRLSLNSANILIPEIPGLRMKYVLAILNSSAAAFWLAKRFRSVKMLRSHLEALPIPVVPDEVQEQIVREVERIMSADRGEDVEALYGALDAEVMRLYGLTDVEAETIRTALRGKPSFLR